LENDDKCYKIIVFDSLYAKLSGESLIVYITNYMSFYWKKKTIVFPFLLYDTTENANFE